MSKRSIEDTKTKEDAKEGPEKNAVDEEEEEEEEEEEDDGSDKAEQEDTEVKKPKMSFGIGKMSNKFGSKTGARGINMKLASTGINMKLASTQKQSTLLPLKKPLQSVFNTDSDESEEEMPPEARMRMRNIGRETPTSAGPNSFGKTKQGFCDAKKVFEKNLRKAAEEHSGDAEPKKKGS